MAMTACAAKLRHQLNLLIIERAYLLAVDEKGANQLVFFAQGHGNK